jgi:hypothetical protein
MPKRPPSGSESSSYSQRFAVERQGSILRIVCAPGVDCPAAACVVHTVTIPHLLVPFSPQGFLPQVQLMVVANVVHVSRRPRTVQKLHHPMVARVDGVTVPSTGAMAGSTRTQEDKWAKQVSTLAPQTRQCPSALQYPPPAAEPQPPRLLPPAAKTSLAPMP